MDLIKDVYIENWFMMLQNSNFIPRGPIGPGRPIAPAFPFSPFSPGKPSGPARLQ